MLHCMSIAYFFSLPSSLWICEYFIICLSNHFGGAIFPVFWGSPNNSVDKESTCNAGDPGLIPGLGRSPGEGNRLPTPVFLGFPCALAGRESACNAGDLGSVPGLGRSPGEGNRLATPVFWPGGFHGLYSPWSRRESDVIELLSLSYFQFEGDYRLWIFRHNSVCGPVFISFE